MLISRLALDIIRFAAVPLLTSLVIVTYCRADTLAESIPGGLPDTIHIEYEQITSVTIAHSLDYRPLNYVDTNGVSDGMLIDFWKLWSEKTGVGVTFVGAPWHECLKRVADGEIDIIAGAFYSH